MPTFGATISIQEANTETVSGFTSSLISNSKNEVMSSFLSDHPDCKSLTTKIEVPGDFDWLNFNISDNDKLYLFKKGVSAGLDFLTGFNWQQYKAVRNSGVDHRFCNPYVSSREAS